MSNILWLGMIASLAFYSFSSDEQEFEAARLRIESGDQNQQSRLDAALLQRLARGKGQLATDALAALTCQLRSEGKPIPGGMVQKLREASKKQDGTWDFSNYNAVLEYARYCATEKHEDPSSLIDSLALSGNAAAKILAAELAGDLLLLKNKHADAIGRYAFAQAIWKSDQYVRESPRITGVMKRIEASLLRAKRSIEVEKYGQEFVLYRDAETHRRCGRFKQAIEVYRELIKHYSESVFAEAAQLYVGYCFIGDRQFNEANAQFKKIIDGNPWGVYRGEALVAAAELRLNVFLDVQGSSALFQNALAWIESITNAPVNLNPFMPPERSLEVTSTPRDVVARDQFGNISHARIKDGSLLNHLTTPWYLDDLRLRVHSSYGFVLLVEGDVDAAKEQFEQHRKLDKIGLEKEKLQMGSFAERMAWNIANNKGCLRAYPEEAAVFKESKRRLVMFLGDLSFEKEEWNNARTQYQRLLTKELGRCSPAEEAYAWSAIAHCESRLSNHKSAAENFKVFLTKWQDTPTAPRALLTCANMLSGGARNEVDCAEAGRLFTYVAKRYAGSAYEEEAVYFGGLTYFYGRSDNDVLEANKWFEHYRKRFPEGYHKHHVTPEALEEMNPGWSIRLQALLKK